MLSKKVKLISRKGYGFLLGRTHFTVDDGYQRFLGFVPMLNSLMLDNNKKVINWISTGVSPEKIDPFHTNDELTISNLSNGRVSLKFNNSVLVQEHSS